MSDESGEGHKSGLDRKEQRQVDKQARVGARVVYQTIRKEGDDELARPASSLWWSGVAAGVAISSSILMQGYLQSYLPEARWSPLVAKLGYCVGFLIVVLGRMQLFTENTVTAVLPVLADRSLKSLGLMLRLWAIVLAANLVGTSAASLLTIHGGFATPEQLTQFYKVSLPLAQESPAHLLALAMPAGFFVAAMAWMVAASRNGQFWVVAVMSYVIALGGFAHVVAGSVELFLLMFSGQVGTVQGLFGILMPVLLGNMLGGTGLFALLAYGQVKGEIRGQAPAENSEDD